MESTKTIDVRTLEPAAKHPTIFHTFESLRPGDGMMIVNDHDPKPLYYQFMMEKQNQFDWKYLQQGPTVWQVLIRKTAVEKENPTIREIITRDFSSVGVFKKYGLDFCCGGKKTLSEACAEKGLDENLIRFELQKSRQTTTPGLNRFEQWSPDFLIEYIIQNHHQYLKAALSDLPPFVQKIADVHGSNHPELKQVAAVFFDLIEEINSHLEKEEQILFPLIIQLVNLNKNHSLSATATIEKYIQELESEHQNAGNGLEKLRRLTDSYSVPDDGCDTYRMVYQKLHELEDDLHQHIHLENNILFPKVIELEQKFLS